MSENVLIFSVGKEGELISYVVRGEGGPLLFLGGKEAHPSQKEKKWCPSEQKKKRESEEGGQSHEKKEPLVVQLDKRKALRANKRRNV